MDTTDVAIVGAGPAGATAARLLARWGHAVVLLAAPPVRRSFAESLPPSIRRLFDALDLLAPIDAAGFYRSTGNTVWWDGADARVEPFPGGEHGYQVDRRAFDDALLREADASGAAILRAAIVRQIAIDAADRATISYELNGEARFLDARFVLDCSGRAGVLARQGFRRAEAGHATLALVAAWRSPQDGWTLPDPTHTLIEAYTNGWAWSVPLSAGERYVTVMVDRREADLKRGGGLSRAYHRELTKTRRLGPLIARGSIVEAPWSADASLYSSSQYTGGAFLLVGDAGSCIDPLSSFGVKKAMASAWLAAVVTNTCLVNAPMQSAALEFFDARERSIYASYLQQSSAFFGDGAARYAHAFWTDRAEPHDTSLSMAGDESLVRDPRVAAAWSALRGSEAVAFERSGTLEMVSVPAVRGRQVVLERAVTVPGLSSPLRYIRGVDVVSIVDHVTGSPDVPELFARYRRASGEVRLPDFLAALSALLGAGLIRNIHYRE